MKEITLVGDYLGTTEEFLAGKGAYADEGKIYASIIGKKVLDSERHVARVEGNFPEKITVGQVVFGEVLDVRENLVQVIVKKIQGAKGKIDVKTGIYVSNIADEYVQKTEDKFGIGDIVKGKVIKIMQRTIDLSTKGEFGVVKAFCKRCRHPLLKPDSNGNLLECKNCGSRENRKIASDYGNVTEI